VIMLGMDQGIIPDYRATTVESKREPRRLFYVGLTRARHEVHMAYSGYTLDRYKRVHANGPSEFLTELREKLAADGEADA
jgi:DNA helicase-2/ATP-dependent DNA helicase PcrA